MNTRQPGDSLNEISGKFWEPPASLLGVNLTIQRRKRSSSRNPRHPRNQLHQHQLRRMLGAPNWTWTFFYFPKTTPNFPSHYKSDFRLEALRCFCRIHQHNHKAQHWKPLEMWWFLLVTGKNGGTSCHRVRLSPENLWNLAYQFGWPPGLSHPTKAISGLQKGF